jgi:hypothetical protein
MGCGCGKSKNAGVPAAAQAAAREVRSVGRIAVYQVVVGGEVVTSTESAGAARQEANRLGGSLRVTSREARQEELKQPAPV